MVVVVTMLFIMMCVMSEGAAGHSHSHHKLNKPSHYHHYSPSLPVKKPPPQVVVKKPAPQQVAAKKTATTTKQPFQLSPDFSNSYFRLKMSPEKTVTTSCNVTGEFSIEVLNQQCKRPQFYIRLWNRNQVMSLKPTSHLTVPYVIYASNKGDMATYVSVTMMYCDYNKDNIHDNLLSIDLVHSPQLLTLEKPPHISYYSKVCPPSPQRWKMTDAPVPAEEMEKLLLLVRTQLGHKYIEKKREHSNWFTYDDIPQCFIPAKRESICIVGDSHARTLQLLLNRDLYKESTCYHSGSVQRDVLYTSKADEFSKKKQPCPLDSLRRFPYVKALFVRDFNETYFTGCHDILVTYGLWDLAVYVHQLYQQNPNQQYSAEGLFRSPIRNVVQGLSTLKKTSRIFFLSTDYTPIRANSFIRNNTDPPNYIIPTVVDELNDIIRSEIEQLNDQKVQFLDMTDIISPLWDSAADYNHYFEIVGKYMARKIACTLFPTS